MQLLFIDPENRRHYVTLLKRSATHGFYVVQCENRTVLNVHHDQLLAQVSPAQLDRELDGDMVPIRHVRGVASSGEVVNAQEQNAWTEWRNDAPEFGRLIAVAGCVTDARTHAPYETVLHSALELESLRQRGYSHWRYV